jgi:hypothetical protein
MRKQRLGDRKVGSKRQGGVLHFRIELRTEAERKVAGRIEGEFLIGSLDPRCTPGILCRFDTA